MSWMNNWPPEEEKTKIIKTQIIKIEPGKHRFSRADPDGPGYTLVPDEYEYTCACEGKTYQINNCKIVKNIGDYMYLKIWENGPYKEAYLLITD